MIQRIQKTSKQRSVNMFSREKVLLLATVVSMAVAQYNSGASGLQPSQFPLPRPQLPFSAGGYGGQTKQFAPSFGGPPLTSQPPYGSVGGPVFRPSSPPAYYGGWSGQPFQLAAPGPFQSQPFYSNGMGPSMSSFPAPQQSPYYSAPPSSPFPYGAVPPMNLSPPPSTKPLYLNSPSYSLATANTGNSAMPSPTSFPTQQLMQYPSMMQGYPGGPSSAMQPSAGTSYGTAPPRQQIPSSYGVSGQQSAESSLDIQPTFGVPPPQQPSSSPSGSSDYSMDNSLPSIGSIPPLRQQGSPPDFLPIYASSSSLPSSAPGSAPKPGPSFEGGPY